MNRVLLAILITFPSVGLTAVTAYQGASLVDGTNTGVIENATIVVQDDRFIAVGQDSEIPEGAEIVDVSGKWIVPGLIDAHIHFMTSGRMYTRPAFFDLTDKVPYEDEIAWIKSRLPQTLNAFMCSGVTGAVSLGGPSLEYNARALAETMDDAPTIFIGHGVIAPMPKVMAENAIPPWDGEMTIKPATTEEDVLRLVAEAVENDANLIKTALDNRNSAMMSALLWWFDWQELEKLVIEEAAKHGLGVTTHAHALQYAKGAVEAGVSSLQHIPSDVPVDQAFVDMVKENDVIIAPTLAIYQRTFYDLISKDFEPLPVEQLCSVPGVVESWREPVPPLDGYSAHFASRIDLARANAKMLYENGVKLAVATDSGMIGLAAGSSVHLELLELNKAGIPADYLIHAATQNSAELAGKDDEYGTVEVGKFADFLVLDADPLSDIGNLQKVNRVVKYGNAFSQQELVPLVDTDGLKRSISARLQQAVERDDALPGASAYVIAPGLDLDWGTAAGYSDAAQSELFSASHPIRVSSVTKPFVAATILRLHELGRLELDTSISTYLTEEHADLVRLGPHEPDLITVRHLLTHTSGIIDVFNTQSFGEYIEALLAGSTKKNFTLEEQVRMAAEVSERVHGLGEDQQYTDTGYILLGAIIENLTGQSMAAAVREHSGLGELNLENTWWEVFEEAPKRALPRAKQFFGEFDGDDMGDEPFDLFGGGGLVSSSHDLAKYFWSLYQAEPFDDPATLEMMKSKFKDFEPLRHGLQYWDFDGKPIYGHGGWWGVNTFYSPEDNVLVVVNWLQQHAGQEMSDLAKGIVKDAIWLAR